MKIEVLYCDGCPNHKPTVDLVQQVLKDEGISAEVSEVNIPDERAARAAGFLGSPSVRINGRDVEPAARWSAEFGMMCRIYPDGGTRIGLPSREFIRRALREAANTPPSANEYSPITRMASRPSQRAHARRGVLFASVAAAVGASLCCILPIVAAVTGLGAIGAGLALETWRPYMLGVTGLLLAAGLVLAYRDHKKACAPGSLCAAKPVNRWNLVALGAVAMLVAGLAAFPYYSGAVAEALVGKSIPSNTVGPAALATVTFGIPDMDCAACAVALSATLQKLQGVKDAKLEVNSRQAVVTYDPSSQNIVSLQKVISDSGFHVASTSGS